MQQDRTNPSRHIQDDGQLATEVFTDQSPRATATFDPAPLPIPTLAALKRLSIGTALYCLHNHSGPCRLYRRIVKMQTNAFAYIGDGVKPGHTAWTYWGSAQLFEPTPTGFRLYYDPIKRERFVEYELLPSNYSSESPTP